MWILKDTESNECQNYRLLCNKTYKIGRFHKSSDLDIMLSGDPSVSRLHAEILIKFDEKDCTNTENLANVILTDLSKAGTFVDNSRIEGFKSLKSGDVIKFGLKKSFLLQYEPLIVTSSCLDSSDKREVKSLICQLGGYLVNDWQNDCTHVVMSSITITVKVIDALICQKLVVTKKYLLDILESLEKKTELPDPKNYLPPIGEDTLDSKSISFDPCLKRKTLFKNKKFIFFTGTQLAKTQNVIELAMGECELFDKSIHLNVKNLKSSINSCLFIESTETRSKEIASSQNKLIDLLNGFNHRLIDETEIGLAILYSNLNEHCNPVKKEQKPSRRISPKKLGSQTLGYETNYFEDDLNEDSERSQQIDAALEPLSDSMALQYEKKISEFNAVPDSLDQNLDFTAKIFEKSSSIQIKDASETIDKKNLFVESAFSPRSKRKIESSKDSSSTIKLKDSFTSFIQNEESSISCNSVIPKRQFKESSINIANNNRGNNHSKLKNEIKKEKEIPDVKPFSSSYNYEDLDITYSKLKHPPKDSIKPKVEDENNYKNSQSPIKPIVPPPTLEPIVKYEPLVVKDYKPTCSSSTSYGGSNEKRNFKKFKKVPKASQLSQASAKIRASNSDTMFKSFRNEKSVDINTQFQLFMSQMS